MLSRKLIRSPLGTILLPFRAAISAPPDGGYKQIPKKGKLKPGRSSFTLFGVCSEQFHPVFFFKGPFFHQKAYFSCTQENDPHLPWRWMAL